ncbi:hypothetical protein LSUE1_G005772 [Lachnellula suecica]|uniref:Uncharacterized protein n=1 Tax=Lachnellula suecica TaxID=602035 RepID=A0A8T9C0X9_9HELO|nr:hypothetical protein LSUE1_G005772 [Lachnellula suecica]
MCQVSPVTYPCCRRIYVLVSKCPGCPEDWPQSKCPKDFCIQVHEHEPEDRATGTCWRCHADAVGMSRLERDMSRPGLDKSTIVAGLEIFTITDRKEQEEAEGYCWYCGAKGGCYGCGSKEIPLQGRPAAITHRSDICWYCNSCNGCGICERKETTIKEEESLSISVSSGNTKKRARTDVASGGRNGCHTNKRVKTEKLDDMFPLKSSIPIDPLLDSQWAKREALPFLSQSYNPAPGHSGFTGPSTPFSGYGLRDISPGIASHDWQAVNHEGGDDGSQIPNWSFPNHGSMAGNGQYHDPGQQLQVFDSVESTLDPLFSDGNFGASYEGYGDTGNALLSHVLETYNGAIGPDTPRPVDLQLRPSLGQGSQPPSEGT